jgi:hypothetical protein
MAKMIIKFSSSEVAFVSRVDWSFCAVVRTADPLYAMVFPTTELAEEFINKYGDAGMGLVKDLARVISLEKALGIKIST